MSLCEVSHGFTRGGKWSHVRSEEEMTDESIRYQVVTTVRSQAKGEQILARHPDKKSDELSFIVVEDIVREGVWEEVSR